MLYRLDGTAARIHPEQRRHGKAVIGDPAQWEPPFEDGSAPAPTRGNVTMATTYEGFEGRHQSDVIGREEASQWLRSHTTKWECLPHPRPKHAQCLFSGQDFPWWNFLSATPWGQQMSPGVVEFWVVWLIPCRRPAFYVQTETAEYILDLLSNSRHPARELQDRSVVDWR